MPSVLITPDALCAQITGEYTQPSDRTQLVAQTIGEQTQVTNMHFKTSNGGSCQAGTGGGNFFADMSVVRCAAYSTKNSSPYFIRAVQVSNTSYDFYACFSGYLSSGSSYRVDAGAGTWTNCSAFIVGATGTYLDVAPVSSGCSKDYVCSPILCGTTCTRGDYVYSAGTVCAGGSSGWTLRTAGCIYTPQCICASSCLNLPSVYVVAFCWRFHKRMLKIMRCVFSGVRMRD